MHKAPPKILSSTNYKQFVILKENRELNTPHLNKLQRSIERKNLLHLFPIIVNERMEVIEGQHRLTAAQTLRLPVYYVVDNEITGADIAMVNTNRKSWTAKNYIHFYAQQGNASYQHLHQLITKYPKISVTAAIRLSNNNKGDYFGGGGETLQMREGKVECVMSALANKIAEMCDELYNSRYYAFDALFMLNCKKVILQSGSSHTVCINTILAKRHMLPNRLEKLESCLPLLKEIVR